MHLQRIFHQGFQGNWWDPKNLPVFVYQTQKRGPAHTVGNRKYRLCCFQAIGSLLPASAMPSNYFPISVPKSSSKEDLVYLYQIKISFSLMSPPTIVIAVLRGDQSKNQVKLFRYWYRPIGRMEFNLWIFQNNEYPKC